MLQKLGALSFVQSEWDTSPKYQVFYSTTYTTMVIVGQPKRSGWRESELSGIHRPPRSIRGKVLESKNAVRHVCLFTISGKYGGAGQSRNLDFRQMSPGFPWLAKEPVSVFLRVLSGQAHFCCEETLAISSSFFCLLQPLSILSLF